MAHKGKVEPTQIIIGFAGRKGHGKDTAAQALPDDFKLMKFADPLKDMIKSFMRIRGVSEEIIERAVEGDLKEKPLTIWGGKTTRYAMQTLGTEWGRGLIGKDLWTTTLRDRAKTYPKVKVTDVRFHDEVDIIRDLGGVTIRIVNPRKVNTHISDAHDSETMIDHLKVDRVIINDSTVEELHKRVKQYLGLFTTAAN